MYIKQIANTLRTFGECSLNTHEIACETLPYSPRPPRNWLRTLRQAQGTDSSCPYPNITNYTYSYHHAHIFALPYQYIRFLLSIILNIKHPIQHIYTRKLHKLFLRLFSHKNTESCLTIHLIYVYAP